MTKMIYLASPFSSTNKKVEKKRFIEINKVASLLHMKHSHAFILPITQSAVMRQYNKKLGTDFNTWKKIDFCFIDKCDEVWVVMLEGWTKSLGVTAEIKYCKKKGKRIRYIHPSTLNSISTKDLHEVSYE